LSHNLEILTVYGGKSTNQYHIPLTVAKFTGKWKKIKSGYFIATPRKVCLPTGLEIRVVVYIPGWFQTYQCDIQLTSHFTVWQDDRSDLQEGCAGCKPYSSLVRWSLQNDPVPTI
jgi:hypothetical protein